MHICLSSFNCLFCDEHTNTTPHAIPTWTSIFYTVFYTTRRHVDKDRMITMKTYAYAYECMHARNQNDWNRIWVYAARIVCYKEHITPAQPLISSKLLHNTIVMIQWKTSTTHIRTLFHCGCFIQVYTRSRLLYISFCICLLLFVCGVSFFPFNSVQFWQSTEPTSR